MASRLTEEERFSNLTIEDAREELRKMERDEALRRYNFPATPQKDGYYYIKVSDPAYKGGRRTIKDKSLDVLHDKVYAFECGINGKVKKTVKDVFECVCTKKLNRCKTKEKLISKKNTVGRAECDFKRYIAGTDIENKYIDEVTKEDIKRLVEYNLTRYDLKKSAFRNFRSVLKSIFDLAYEEDWIDRNPYDKINFADYSDMIVPDDDINKRAYSDKEVDMIIAECRDAQRRYPKKVTPWALELLILMGDRGGEVPPLMLCDIVNDEYINIHREQIRIIENGKTVGYEIVNHTKTYRNREFPINSELAEYLSRFREWHDKYYPDCQYMFPLDDTQPINHRQIYNFYYKLVKNLGIARKGVTMGIHSFRRNGITKAAKNTNDNMGLVSEIYGNSPVTAAKNYRLKYSIAEKKRALGA